MQLKWSHLFEADDANQELFRKWIASGDEDDQKAWLRAEMRRGKQAARALKLHVPPDVDDVRDEVVRAAGRALFVSTWADREEEEGRGIGGGADWMDVAPETSRRAARSGEALIRRIEQTNRLNINQLYWVAENMPGRHYRTPNPTDFGHYLAMQALGHGVSWDDDHPDPQIQLPHWDFNL